MKHLFCEFLIFCSPYCLNTDAILEEFVDTKVHYKGCCTENESMLQEFQIFIADSMQKNCYRLGYAVSINWFE